MASSNGINVKKQIDINEMWVKKKCIVCTTGTCKQKMRKESQAVINVKKLQFEFVR